MSVELSVCVCLSKEKRKKRESKPKERREVGENEWLRMMGSRVRWGMWELKI